jgi:hypothetical protein
LSNDLGIYFVFVLSFQRVLEWRKKKDSHSSSAVIVFCMSLKQKNQTVRFYWDKILTGGNEDGLFKSRVSWEDEKSPIHFFVHQALILL